MFLQSGEGERIAGDGDLRVTLLADVEQIGVIEVRAPPSGGAARMHLHPRHAECFFVREGELTFHLGDRELRAGPGSWVSVPPEVAHTFAVTGEGWTRFLNIHVPSRGFGDFMRGLHSARSVDELRAVREAFDQRPVPEDGGTDPGSVVQRTVATAKAVEVSGNRIAFLARAEETGGAIGAIEFTAPQTFQGAPPHVHRGMIDAVVVLEGTLEVELGDERHTAKPGAFVLVPPGLAHTFSNRSGEPLRFLNLYVPGGFERFFEQRAAAAADGSIDPAVARELTSRYDWERAQTVEPTQMQLVFRRG